MDVKKLLVIGLVVGVVMNVLDFVFQGNLFASMYAAPPFRNTDDLVPWLVTGDFVAALVFAFVYLKLGGGYRGIAGGATFGLIAGLFASFPAFHFIQLLIDGIPYSFAWIQTIYGICWYGIAGATAGALNK